MYFAYSNLCDTLVKEAVGDKLAVAAVGMINNGETAEKILSQDNIDVIHVGRAFQRDTGMAWHFAKDLDVEISMLHKSVGVSPASAMLPSISSQTL
jgi:2,4-dienoyl-CoA reductase-like NADH-dependent reductase (Old Yellow Enzyme family)